MSIVAVSAVTIAGIAVVAAFAAATPADVATGGPVTLDLPTEPWWGGSDYYASWEKASAVGWTDPGFFPIAVFYGKPAHAEALADVGINTFLGAEHDGSPISSMTERGISVIAQAEWTSAEVGDDPDVVGWNVSDECDMGLSGCDSPEGELGSLEIQRSYVDALRAKDDGRFLQANFGNGVLGTHWSPTTMDDHVALVDVSSVDKYAFTSPHVRELIAASSHWPAERAPGSAFAYGWLQDRMETFSAPEAPTPNWIFVETARPFLIEDGASTMTVDQMRAAAWSGLIHGAAGVAYFQHNNDDSCGVYSLVDCGTDLRSGVAQINAEITALAPVLNSPTYVWDAGDGVDTAVKTYDGHAYIFAMTDGGSGERTLRLPPGLQGPVDVIGSNRTLDVRDGAITDDFATADTVHLYRLPLGGAR
jgi:hypothetical protein